MILILGETADPHIQIVSRHLHERGSKYCIVDPFETPALPGLRMCTEEQLPWDAVWDRIKPLANGTADTKTAYIIRERLALLRSISAISTVRAMNDPMAADKARSKPLQLRLARDFGFEIPKTYVGNRPSEILKLMEACPSGVVAKSLTWYFDQQGRFSFTQRVNAEEITSALPGVALSPLIYQELIEKAFELRITVVGRDIFAAKIFSQELPDAHIDWRKNQYDLRYETYEIAPDFRRKLLDLHNNFGLNFGAYDFIVTPDQRLVFLEVNSAGNWLWLENKLDEPIAFTVAQWLAEGDDD